VFCVYIFKSLSFMLVLIIFIFLTYTGQLYQAFPYFMILSLENFIPNGFSFSLTWLLRLSFCQWFYTKSKGGTFLTPISFFSDGNVLIKTSRAFQNNMSRFSLFLSGQFLSCKPIRAVLMMSKVRSVKATQSRLL
jgi:hypothetical protein